IFGPLSVLSFTSCFPLLCATSQGPFVSFRFDQPLVDVVQQAKLPVKHAVLKGRYKANHTHGCRAYTGKAGLEMRKAKRYVFRTENVLWVQFKGRRGATGAPVSLRGIGVVPWPMELLEPSRGRRRGNEGQS